ncbi:MAG: NUDIX domain-containing protein [Caldilineaceae bacterium]
MDKGLIVHALIVNADGEVLLIKRSETEDVLPGVWDIPGGTLEDGEDPKDGATREVKEETNLEVRNLCLFHYTSNVDQEKNKQFVRLIFVGECASSGVCLNPEDHDEYRWVSPDNIPKDMNLIYFLPRTLEMFLQLMV